MVKRLRSGFTTGSCSAAAAKAAASAIATGKCPEGVDIPFPDGSRHSFAIANCSVGDGYALASIVKDAGDDPDVTNGAEISAHLIVQKDKQDNGDSATDCVTIDKIQICRGKGIGIVTKPGLAISPGQPAINPVPRQMIVQALQEVYPDTPLKVTISIPKGEILAEKTLNHRLGIVGGLSILGTTGIVRPVSADAWTATISASMDVAREAGLKEIVLSTGRTSEKGAQQILELPIEAFAMMGDYLEFSIKEAVKKDFSTIHLSGMWAKIMKAALRIPQTHVRNGALEIVDGAKLLQTLGAEGVLLDKIKQSNSAREMLSHIDDDGNRELIDAVCHRAKEYVSDVTGVNVRVYLVDHKAELITHV